MTLLYILGLSILGGLVGLVGALFIVDKLAVNRERLFQLVSFAAGAMLSAAFFDLLPEALEQWEPMRH